jgi:O-antigen/teichoic acid export membrane protein
MNTRTGNTRTGNTRTGTGRLVSGTIWNALGRGLPLILALALTPLLLQLMGIERWGLFTLALALVGVMGVLDLGVGPALTRALSERMDTATTEEQAALVRAGLWVLGLVGMLGALSLWLAVPVLVHRVLNVPPALQAEAMLAMRILACAIPLVVINAALWGVLAAYQRFAAANLVTVPVNVLYYVGPLLVLLVWPSLVGVMLALVACRLANTISYIWLARRNVPGFWRGWPRIALARPLLRIGGWITAAALMGQGLLYADRFIIGAQLTLTDVAYYATSLDLIIRMWILPVAVAQALLPAMAGSFAAQPEATTALLRRGGLIILLLVFGPCAVLAGAAHEVLWLWLGRGFADGGAVVLSVLAVGILFSCLAYAPNALIEAVGRPDMTARFVLLQALLFLPLAALAVWWGGIVAAACVWALRVGVDALGKLWIAARVYPAARDVAQGLVAPMLAACLTLAALALLPGWWWKAAALAVGGAALCLLCWRALGAAERAALRRPREWRAMLRA